MRTDSTGEKMPEQAIFLEEKAGDKRVTVLKS
jgi:hypothetical protein